jgi:hypothetical protein
MLFANSKIAAQQHFSESIYLTNSDEVAFKNAVNLLQSCKGIVRVVHLQAKNINSFPTIQYTYTSEADRVAAMQIMLSNGYLAFNVNDRLPADFPRLFDDGSKESEIAFEESKQIWIQNNPERYSAMNQQSGILIIPQSEFNQMSPEKQQQILAHPELYQIEP